MKALQLIFVGFLIVALSSCSDLLGNEELVAELEEPTRINGVGCICDYVEIAIIVDGEIWDSEKLSERLSGITPENISDVEVSKKTADYKKYNVSEDTRGIIFITTKKGSKN